MKRLKIGNKWIGQGEPVFLIAEAGVNHNGDIKLAKKMIDTAVEVGADAVKFQSYKTESIITESAPSARYHIEATGGKESWFNLLKRLELGEKEQKELFTYCLRKGIMFFSTPYDEKSADFLNSLEVAAFKIASTDLNNIAFLEHVADYGKPILLSTGMSDLGEIRESVQAIVDRGNNQVVLLQCTSNYPPALEDANLNVIETLRKEFKLPVGYSDHYANTKVVVAAVAKGACVYEVHFTLDKKMSGPDQKSSLEPDELKQIINDIHFTERILGSAQKKVTASEKETRLKLRKSLIATVDIKAGEKFTQKNVGVKRPGSGLPPRLLNTLLGKTAKKSIIKDILIQRKDIKGQLK